MVVPERSGERKAAFGYSDTVSERWLTAAGNVFIFQATMFKK
jgi:hypothetical protein